MWLAQINEEEDIMSVDYTIVEQKRKEAAELLKVMITDATVRNVLFGKDVERKEFLGDAKQILFYISKLLILAYHYIYLRYRRWTEVDNEIDGGPKDKDLIRIFKVMRKMYVFNELSYEVMESILVDLQIDIALNGLVSQELRITHELKQSPDFAKMAYLAKKVKTDSRFNDLTGIEERIKEFMGFIKNFAFLKNLSARLEPVDDALFYHNGVVQGDVKLLTVRLANNDYYAQKEFVGEIDTYNCLIKVARSYYYLTRVEFIVEGGNLISANESMESQKDSKILGIKLNYTSMEPTKNYISVIVSSDKNVIKEFDNTDVFFINSSYEEYCCKNFPFESFANFAYKKPIIEDFYSINYKYIRNLSLAIVDIIKPEDRNVIYNHYAGDKRYKILFEGDDDNRYDGEGSGYSVNCNGNLSKQVDFDSLQWDVIIAILMVEEGAGKLLQAIFSKNISAFSNLLKNLELRFGRELFPAKEIMDKTSVEIVKEVEKLHHRNSVGIGKGVGFVYDRERDSIRVEVQVRTIIANVTRAVNGNQIVNEKVGFPLSIRSRIQLLDSICSDTSEKPKQKIEKSRAIVNQTISTLIIFYRGLIKYMKQKTIFENESYFRVLTDEEIEEYQSYAQSVFNIEAKKQKKLIEKKEDGHKEIFGMLKDLCDEYVPGGEGYQVLKHMLGRQQLMDCDYVTETLEECWQVDADHATNFDAYMVIRRIIEVFRYLQTGEKKDNGIWDIELSLKAIFPFVATYQYAKQTGDGYHINNFSIISAQGQDVNIKVLSEFKYKLNEKYYCLPNKQRSADSLKLWIEPVLIKYEEDILDE